MSHFLTVVIVPNTIPLDMVDDELSRLLAPYSEQLEVAEHDEECYCVSNVAEKRARAATDKKFGTWDVTRESFQSIRQSIMAKHKGNEESEEVDELINAAWTKHIQPRQDFEKAKAKADKAWGKPKRGCEECKGTGFYKSTRNPKSQWDWWRVGGRWDGWLTGLPDNSTDNGFNFSHVHETLPKNMVLTENYDSEKISYALVTPDGEWHQRGKMGWWGMSSDEMSKDEWKEYFMAQMKKYPNHRAISCDMHT